MTDVLQDLEVVNVFYKDHALSKVERHADRVPKLCGQCASPMYVKKGWHKTGYDTQTGEANRYSATIYCSKLKGFRPWYRGYHDMRELVFTPPKFNWPISDSDKKGKVAGLSVLTIMRLGV